MSAKLQTRPVVDATVPEGMAEETAVAGGERFVDDYLLYLLARASHQASAQFHALAKARGISPVAWRVLSWLSDGPSSIGELAAVTLLQQPTLTKLIDRMTADGLVARRPEPSDGRRVRVEITARGRALVADLLPLAQQHEDRVLDGYAPEEAGALKAALKTLIARTE